MGAKAVKYSNSIAGITDPMTPRLIRQRTNPASPYFGMTPEEHVAILRLPFKERMKKNGNAKKKRVWVRKPKLRRKSKKQGGKSKAQAVPQKEQASGSV